MKNILSINIVITLICASCLFYQVGLLLQQFLNKDVITNIQFVKNQADSMPGITICYDKIFSFDKLAERYTEYGEIYNNFTEFMKSLEKINIKVGKFHYEENSKYFDYHAELNSYYLENIRLGSLDVLPSYKDIVENLSIPLQQLFFRSKIIDFLINNGIRINGDDAILGLEKPIESLFFLPRHKCFTFFSQLELSSKRLKLIIKKIYIVIYTPWQAIPYSNLTTVYLAIHSPNIMPNRDSFITMNLSSRIDLVYTKFEYDQLPSFSGCNRYLETNNPYKTQSDCIFNCQKRYYNFDCLAEFYYDQDFPIRSEQLPNESPNSTCDWQSLGNIDYYKMRETCMVKCPDECYHVYYLLQTKEIKFHKSLIWTSNPNQVNLIQSNLPTIIIKQLPEMSLISLLCNFGGLLGMWLGVSLLTTFNNICNTGKNIFCKLITKISFTNNNITNLFIMNPKNKIIVNEK